MNKILKNFDKIMKDIEKNIEELKIIRLELGVEIKKRRLKCQK